MTENIITKISKFLFLTALVIAFTSVSSCGGRGERIEPAEDDGSGIRTSGETVTEGAILEEADSATGAQYPENPGSHVFVSESETALATRHIILPSQGPLIDFSTDAALVVETIEKVHPIFILDGLLPDYYETFREEYLAITAEPITRTVFALATQRYLTALHDGHMGGGGLIDRRNNGILFQDSWFIEKSFTARDSRLFLADNPYVEVIAIGDVPVAEIFYQIDRYYFSENESDRMFNYARLAGYELMLHRAGAEVYSQSSGPGDLPTSLYWKTGRPL